MTIDQLIKKLSEYRGDRQVTATIHSKEYLFEVVGHANDTVSLDVDVFGRDAYDEREPSEYYKEGGVKILPEGLMTSKRIDDDERATRTWELLGDTLREATSEETPNEFSA